MALTVIEKNKKRLTAYHNKMRACVTTTPHLNLIFPRNRHMHCTKFYRINFLMQLMFFQWVSCNVFNFLPVSAPKHKKIENHWPKKVVEKTSLYKCIQLFFYYPIKVAMVESATFCYGEESMVELIVIR